MEALPTSHTGFPLGDRQSAFDHGPAGAWEKKVWEAGSQYQTLASGKQRPVTVGAQFKAH